MSRAWIDNSVPIFSGMASWLDNLSMQIERMLERGTWMPPRSRSAQWVRIPEPTWMCLVTFCRVARGTALIPGYAVRTNVGIEINNSI